ncbi:AmmeMemoRadiSam system radical SAM enzyme [candidate division KSB1 bacterium]|nr:AmmeMemoRadiSam system radical SAM enzyme [Candidatus Aminicenantes bacterium]RQW03635.1 MAG: AmmeMemoRadiSam system radical SAM enzyme [candidate division KSB1 bacterium]
MIKADLYETDVQNQVICRLCAHQCRLPEGSTGICRVRKNVAGVLYSLNSDHVVAMHLDPIEKKPLYHFLPGATTFSIAAMGCNFSCRFCQNYSISMVTNEQEISGESVSPEQLVQFALQNRASSISYTYTEPTVFFELMLETARLAHQHGIKNIMVSNGYMSRWALSQLEPFIDAANIDLKAFSEKFYKKYCRARLQPVLETIAAIQAGAIWLEITTLLIPGLNDDREEIKRLIEFLLGLDDQLPWHVSRYFPQYQMQHIPATATESIHGFLDLGSEMGLKYLYGGNMAIDSWNDTHCPNCKGKLIRRQGYHSEILALQAGNCQFCGQPIAGIWQS